MSDEGHPDGGQSEQGGTQVPIDEGLPSWSATRSGPPTAADPDTTAVAPTPPSPPVRDDATVQAQPAPPVEPVEPAPPAEPVAPAEPGPIVHEPIEATVDEAPSAPAVEAIDPYLAAETEQVLHTEPLPTLEEYEPQSRSRTPMLLAGALALAVVALGIGWFIGSQSSSTDASGEAQATSDASADDATEGAATSADGVTTTTVVDEPAAPTSVTVIATEIPSTTVPSGPFVLPETPDNPSGATQYAVMADGKAYMRGWYPDPAIAQQAVADAATIMGGMENVVDETQIDPRAEIRPDDFAVYLQDFILFESDSAEITEEFYEFLGFPLFFMQNNEAARVTVVARTDASGTEAYNLALATRRAEAVRDFWLANGGNADQIILDPRGEEGASEDADDAQAALDRRVELQVAGFLAG